jgi:hypothetical protein
MQKLKKKTSKSKLTRHGLLPPLKPPADGETVVKQEATGDSKIESIVPPSDVSGLNKVTSLPQTERLPEIRVSDMRAKPDS